MLRLVLCGAVAGVLLSLAISSFDSDPPQPDRGITIVESAQTQQADNPGEQEAVESLGNSERGLAQVWLIAFGAGAFFLLELVSPLGIFYARSVPERARTAWRRPRERGSRLRVPAP